MIAEDYKNGNLFLGHDVKYWIELEKKAEILNVVDYIEEISLLRGKISFYEYRIAQMNSLMNKTP